MKTLLNIVAINISKLTSFTSKALNMGAGTSLPGKLAQKISPDVLYYLIKQAKREVIFVTGTNGKTTTSGLIAGILQADNRKIAHNRKGANMITGLITALSNTSSITGNLNADNCLLEVDEAYFAIVAGKSNPNVIALTNLFRDQLDRYGELDTTAKKILEGLNSIEDKSKLILVVNADDPITTNVANQIDCKKLYYGIDNIRYLSDTAQTKSQGEITTCSCGKNYKYSKNFYSHIGHYYCNCGQERPFADVMASNVEIDVDSSDISMVTPSGSFSFSLKMPGLYNVYNALAAVATGIALNISPETITDGIQNYSTVFGRAEVIKIKNKDVLIQLIKNPVGATEVLKTVAHDPDGRLVIGINDNYADGRDVSWLWDADFGLLEKHSKEIVCTGVRASDMAVRLKYSGVDQSKITVNSNIRESIEYMVDKISANEKLYILPTYTVLLDMQKFMPELVKK